MNTGVHLKSGMIPNKFPDISGCALSSYHKWYTTHGLHNNKFVSTNTVERGVRRGPPCTRNSPRAPRMCTQVLLSPNWLTTCLLGWTSIDHQPWVVADVDEGGNHQNGANKYLPSVKKIGSTQITCFCLSGKENWDNWCPSTLGSERYQVFFLLVLAQSTYFC